MRRRKSRGQAMVEFALLSGLLFLLVMGIFDFGRAIAVYINIAEAAHEGARQLILRSNYSSTPPDTVIVNATLAKIGGGGMVLTEDPCLSNPTPCSFPSIPTTPNTGYIWMTPPSPPNWTTPQPPGYPCAYCRTTGNHEVTVRVTYLYAPMTGMISNLTGAAFIMSAGSSMRSEY
jgi:TadE-like protein